MQKFVSRMVSLLLAAIIFNHVAYGQDQFYTRYVDFHVHTTLKNYYRNVPDPNDTLQINNLGPVNWEKQHIRKIKPKNSGVYNRRFLLMRTIYNYDQATFNEIQKGNASMLCTSLYSVEKQSISNKKIRVPILGTKIRVRLSKVNKKFVTGLPYARQALSLKPENYSYKELQAEVRFLRHQVAQSDKHGRRIMIAETKKDIDDTTAIRLILTIEGAHAFFGPNNGSVDSITRFKSNHEAQNEIIDSLKAFLQENRVFFISPAHLFWNQIVGHARGLDVALLQDGARGRLAKAMWDTSFASVDGKDAEGVVDTFLGQNESSGCNGCCCSRRPYVNSPDNVTNIGWRFIDTLLSTCNKWHKPTLVDLRHMDVLARIEYINYIKEKRMNIPLIVSHAAVSGKDSSTCRYFGLCPWNDAYDEYRQRKNRQADFYKQKEECLENTGIKSVDSVDKYMDSIAGWFHPMSNNLYDEEIQAVFESKGIIGITMEERALGKDRPNYRKYAKEFNYRRERVYTELFGKKIPRKTMDSLKIAEPFVRNMFYMVKHAQRSGVVNVENWKIIAIGSDFDGIMNPIDICPTAAAIPNFYSFLNRYLYLYAIYLNEEKLLVHQEPGVLLKMVFFQNGERFIRDNL